MTARPYVFDITVKADPLAPGFWIASARVAYDDGDNETVPGTPTAGGYADAPVAAARAAADNLREMIA